MVVSVLCSHLRGGRIFRWEVTESWMTQDRHCRAIRQEKPSVSPWPNTETPLLPIPSGGNEAQVDEDHFRHTNMLPGPSGMTIQQVQSHLSLLFFPNKKVGCVSQSSPSAQRLGSCYWLFPAFHNFWPLLASSIYTAPPGRSCAFYSVLSTTHFEWSPPVFFWSVNQSQHFVPGLLMAIFIVVCLRDAAFKNGRKQERLLRERLFCITLKMTTVSLMIYLFKE